MSRMVCKRSKHLKKHLTRLRRELVYLKNITKRSFEEVSTHVFSEEEGKKVAEMIQKDLQVLTHIDGLITCLDEMLEQTKNFKYSKDLYTLTGPSVRLVSGQTIEVEADPDGIHIIH